MVRPSVTTSGVVSTMPAHDSTILVPANCGYTSLKLLQKRFNTLGFGSGFNTRVRSNGDSSSKAHLRGAPNSSKNGRPIEILNAPISLTSAGRNLKAKRNVEGVMK